MAHFAIRTGLIAAVVAPLALSGAWGPAPAHADNQRLNSGVIANVFTIQRQAGCTTNVKADPKLRLAAEWHTNDLLADRSLDDHAGSDGSTPQSRAEAAGFRGRVAETVAINPALAINGIEILNQWYYDPVDFAILSDCANTAIGVWSANSFDRSVVVAVLGRPADT